MRAHPQQGGVDFDRIQLQGRPIHLPGSGTDAEYYKKRIGETVANQGHVLRDGEYGIALPSIPQDLAKKCAGSAFRDPEQVGHRDKINDKPVKPQLADCSEIKNHMVSQSELREIFGDRKVFGFADSCHSGDLDLGENSMMMVAKRMTHVKATGRQAFLGYTRNGPMGVMRTDGNVQRPCRTGAMGTSWASCVMLARSEFGT